MWLSTAELSTLRIGAKLPNSGPLPQALGIPAMARALEAAGFDWLWVADHVVLPRSIDSHYPFAADGTRDLALRRALRRGADRARARGVA